MKSKQWKIDQSLVTQGWHFFSLAGTRNAESRLIIENASERFRSVLPIQSDYGLTETEENVVIYVRGFPSIPKNQNPGGGFIKVGCRNLNEPITPEYLTSLKDAFSKHVRRFPKSILVLDGPWYFPSPIARGQFERSYNNGKIIWMR